MLCTILHRTDQIISAVTVQTIVIALMMSTVGEGAILSGMKVILFEDTFCKILKCLNSFCGLLNFLHL